MGEIQIASTPRRRQIVEPPFDALEIADAVAVRVLERARVDLVDHACLPPQRGHLGSGTIEIGGRSQKGNRTFELVSESERRRLAKRQLHCRDRWPKRHPDARSMHDVADPHMLGPS